ncbi:hypothetical protein RRG08_045847 [Elysia crispata]|uniref:Uncharacterized protein n=1 Tax=Elysia crispata TaxID=231223 RepID=A0AAE1B2P8_9GAST|nr:hypothetical protein RRG08_045847 [Elysia crispata]
MQVYEQYSTGCWRLAAGIRPHIQRKSCYWCKSPAWLNTYATCKRKVQVKLADIRSFSVSSPLHSDGDLNLCLMPSNIPVTCLLPNRRVLKQDIDSVPLPAIIDIVNKLEFVYYWTASLYFLSCQHTELTRLYPMRLLAAGLAVKCLLHSGLLASSEHITSPARLVAMYPLRGRQCPFNLRMSVVDSAASTMMFFSLPA